MEGPDANDNLIGDWISLEDLAKHNFNLLGLDLKKTHFDEYTSNGEGRIIEEFPPSEDKRRPWIDEIEETWIREFYAEPDRYTQILTKQAAEESAQLTKLKQAAEESALQAKLKQAAEEEVEGDMIIKILDWLNNL
jgi:hypothetical protein